MGFEPGREPTPLELEGLFMRHLATRCPAAHWTTGRSRGREPRLPANRRFARVGTKVSCLPSKFSGVIRRRWSSVKKLAARTVAASIAVLVGLVAWGEVGNGRVPVA